MEKNKFKIDNFIHIPGFAVVKLHLSGNELLCYSLVYGFSQDGENEFEGSLTYIASALNITKQNAKKVIDRLIEKELIIKREEVRNGVKYCHYRYNEMPLLNQQHPVAETATPPLLKQQHPVAKTTPNNKQYNIFDNIEDNNTLKRGKFVKPTLEQISAYCKERGNNIDAQEFYDYQESVGWTVGKKPMKDWQAAIRTWERKNKENNNNGIYQSRRQDSRRETPAPNRESISEDDWKF